MSGLYNVEHRHRVMHGTEILLSTNYYEEFFFFSCINIFRSFKKLLSEIKVPIPQSTVIIIDDLRYLCQRCGVIDTRRDVKRLLRELLSLAEGKMKLQISVKKGFPYFTNSYFSLGHNKLIFCYA